MQNGSFPAQELHEFLCSKFHGTECCFTLKNNEEAVGDPSVKEILGFKAKFQNWREKADHFMKMGAKGVDLSTVFSSKNEGEKSDIFLMSRIDFIIPALAMVGQIEYISEMKGTRFFREITIASFRTKRRSMIEISYDWREGTKLHGHSLFEFIKNPADFIKKRF